jgi:thiol-disulfide isomerase/thioredoxin
MTHLGDKNPSERTPEWLIGLLIAIVVVTAGWFFLRSVGAGDDPVLGDGSESGASGDASGSFVLFDGTPASFGDFEGPIVVNFWASWCPACVVELPDFQAVSEELGDSVTFIGMNVLPDDRAAAEALIEETGVEYQLAEDEGGALYAEFGGIAMPTTVFLDADGNVVDVHGGTLFEDDLRERISELFGV